VKTLNCRTKVKLAATSLVLVLVVSAASIVLVSGIMSWISTNTDLTMRINQFRTTTAAGGAATEKVVGKILTDFQSGGITAVSNNLASYTTIVPSKEDLLGGVLDPITGILDPILGPSPQPAPEPDSGTDWSNYEFSDGRGNKRKSDIGVVSPWTYSQLSSQFSGVGAYSATYRLVSSVRDTERKHQALAGVQQELVLASIPVFGFHVFYAPDLEICPSLPLTLGRVHANRNIYCQPAGTLTLAGPVTAGQRIMNNKHPADTTLRIPGEIVSVGDREGGVNTLLPALGTNRNLRSLIDIPPLGESRTSALGRQRLYNKADLIIKISNTGFVAHSGASNNFATPIPWSELGEIVEITGGKGKGGKIKDLALKKPKKPKPGDSVTNIYDGVVSTNATFYSLREGKTIRCTEIDVYQLLYTKSNYLYSVLGSPVRTLYVADTRTNGSVQTGVRVIFGQALPHGFTVVTPNPLYVLGDYNVPPTLLGTTNTSKSAPAALIGDAITILSDEWMDTDGTNVLTARYATNTTINAAFLGGIVPTRGGYYSGGVENFPRLLEDWTGKTLTLNGSLVALFESSIATGPFNGTAQVSRPPQRKWSFDTRFNSLAGLPPATPELRTAFRRSWQNVVAQR